MSNQDILQAHENNGKLVHPKDAEAIRLSTMRMREEDLRRAREEMALLDAKISDLQAQKDDWYLREDVARVAIIRLRGVKLFEVGQPVRVKSGYEPRNRQLRQSWEIKDGGIVYVQRIIPFDDAGDHIDYRVSIEPDNRIGNINMSGSDLEAIE